ncbi:unnamed protein product [Rhizophagus irregularis]|nr:unnamed protein product [Rhizophagus irregularis]CAB4419529.1 unnamed protein product [Rhizophagus irregularis]
MSVGDVGIIEDLTVVIDDKTPVSIELEPNETNEKLTKIREKLKNNSLIQMDDSLLFAKKVNNMLALIAIEDEERRTLRNTLNAIEKILYLKYLDEKVNVYTNNSQEPASIRLNLKNSLSEIRQILKKNTLVKMDDTLMFVNKSNENTFAKIAIEDEDKIELKYIIKNLGEKKTLYLRKDLGTKWRYLSNKHKLRYGFNDRFRVVDEPALEIKDCIIKEIGRSHKGETKIDSKDSFDSEECWHLATDVELQSFAKLGISTGNSNTKSSTNEASLTLKFIEHEKVSLTFTIEPTTKFIEAVEEAIKSKNSMKLKEVTDRFGQFIPKEVIFGGKVYLNESIITKKMSKKSTNKGDLKVGVLGNQATFQVSHSESVSNENSSEYSDFRLFGGDQHSSNESEWAKSLEDFKKWSCIKFNPISIFESLSNKLQKEILALTGKIIHHSTTNIIPTFGLDKYNINKPKDFELRIPEYILINDEKADYSIFTAVGDTDEMRKDFFNCQILWPKNGKPKLLIHCIQKEFKKRKCNLKIRWMIIGNNINFNFNSPDFNYQLKVNKDEFNESDSQNKLLDLKCSSSLCFGMPVLEELNDSNNFLTIGHHFFSYGNNKNIKSYIFSYSLKKKHYVNLPRFNFHTLIIPNHYNSNDYGMSDFKSGLFSFKPDPSKYPLKYLSSYYIGQYIPYPGLLKQKHNEKSLEIVVMHTLIPLIQKYETC